MKHKYLTIIPAVFLLAAVVTGCSPKVPPSPSATTPSASAPPSATPSTPAPSATAPVSPSPSANAGQEALKEIQTLLKTENNEKAALDAMRRLLPGLKAADAGLAAQIVMAFEKYQSDAAAKGGLVTQELADLIQKASPEPYNEKTLTDLTKIQDPALKKALEAFYGRGYKIIIPEGNYEGVIDYGAYKAFEATLPPDLAAYIEIMARESGNRLAEDGAIIVPIDEVYARARLCENFLKQYPTSEKAAQIDARHDNYIDAYIFGFNNTPAFDYSTKKLDQEFLDSYKKAAPDAADSPLAKAVADYLKVLDDNAYKLTKAVTDYRKNMADTLKNTAA